jgi:hypothetical protein
MKKPVRKILKVLGLVLGSLLVLVLAAAFLVIFDKPLVRKIIRNQLGKAAGTTARFAGLDYSLFPFRVTVDSLELVQENPFQKLELSLKRLEAGGKLWKLVRGVKPALDALVIDGAAFRLEQKAKSEEPFDVEALLVQAADMMAWAKRISLTDARLSVSLLSIGADLEDLDLTLEPGAAGDVLAYTIESPGIRFENKDGAFGLATGLSSSGTLRLISPFTIDANFAFRSPRVSSGGIDDSLDALMVSIAGRFDASASDFAVSRLEIGVPGLLDLKGTAAGRFGHSVFADTEATARIESLERVAALLGPRLPETLRGAKLKGQIELAGKYGLHRTAQESTDNIDAALTLRDVEIDDTVGGLPLRVRAGGRIAAAGPTRDPRLTADIRAAVGRIAVSGITVAGSDLRVVAEGTRASMDVSRLDARLSGLVYAAAGDRKISFDTASLSAKASLDLVRQSAALASLEARLPGLSPLRLSGRFGFGKSRAAQIQLESRGLDVAALRTIASPFAPAGLAAWDLAATADLSLAYRRGTSPGDWGASGTVSLAGVTFNDPSFTIAGEGLDPALRFEAASAPSKGLSFTGALAIGRGESLWKDVYVSWSKYPLELTASGRYDPASGAVDGLAARAFLPGIGTIDAAGTARLAPAAAFDLGAKADLSLGPLYSLYAQAGVSEERRMRLEGKLDADVRLLKSGNALSVAGRVRLAEAGLENPVTKTLLAGISADLPVHYESPASPSGGPDSPLSDEGYLRVRELSNKLLSLASVDLPIRSGPNAWGLEPVTLELFGGRLELGRTVFRYDPATGSFRGVGSLALRDIDIARFPIASPQFKLTGKIRAEFPRLDIGPELIGVSGRGEAEVFGGKIVLRDLAVSDPFTPGRSISLNVDLVDLDLKKLTDEVPFGEVTGIVSGEVRGLVLTYNQPARFDFRLESVPRKGVAQTFSLKAVDNLTVLSSGQQASAGTGGFWMRFIRGFRYQKLGIVSTLRNDTFTLSGTIHEGGIEYLVKKPALFGISVVNREPGKVISFKEMTGRLKRVGQSEK